MTKKMPMMHFQGVPVGVWIDAHGINVNLASADAVGFIKTCMHQINLAEGKTLMNDPEVEGVHPGIKAFLKDVGTTK